MTIPKSDKHKEYARLPRLFGYGEYGKRSRSILREMAIEWMRLADAMQKFEP